MQVPHPFSIPDLSLAKRILCIHPHCDDNDLGAGGTQAALTACGAQVIYLTVTDDLVGLVDPRISNERASAQLRDEQLAAGKMIGFREHIWLGCPDAGSYNYFELRRQIVRHIRLPTGPETDAQYTPHTITGVACYFTHAPNTTFDIFTTQALKHQAIG